MLRRLRGVLRAPTPGARRRAPASRRRACVLLIALASAGAAVWPAAGQAYAPPVLSASGETLSWTSSGTQNLYRLLARYPGHQSSALIVGRGTTPQPVAGRTVTYWVKAAHNESAWSNPVSVKYPGAEGEPPEETEPPPEEPEQTPEELGEAVGRPKYLLIAATYFDPFGSALYAPWVKSHASAIVGYPPHSNPYVSLFGLPLVAYHDPATEGQAPLGAAGIAAYVSEVKRDMSLGYAGVFVDDANWSGGFPPSPGPPAALANLLEAIRAAEPSAVIEINSQYHDIWPLMKAHDPNVERALRVVNEVNKEFGVGPTAGINTARDYGEFMEYVDTLHAKGIHTSLIGDHGARTVPVMEYNLATYFLVNNGGDYVSGVNQTPLQWWSGFNVNLGAAVGPRERSASGVWTRRFSNGVVYTVEPEGGTHTIRLSKRMHSPQWGDVEAVTLKQGQGAVLYE
jgi:hypothetical protein